MINLYRNKLKKKQNYNFLIFEIHNLKLFIFLNVIINIILFKFFFFINNFI